MNDVNDPKITYLERRLSDLTKLGGELEQNVFEFALTLGHRLKGHGDNFGFPDISDLGKELENAGKEKSVEKALAVSAQMKDLILNHLSDLKK